MTTDEMKAAIERVRKAPQTCACDVFDTLPTVLALAEIGRLAAEERDLLSSTRFTPAGAIEAEEQAARAIDAFLAARKGGE